MSKEYVYLDEIEAVVNEVIHDMGWKEKPEIQVVELIADNSEYMGKCKRVTGVWKFMTNKDYVLEIWKTAWDSGEPAVRKALIYHELLHIEPSANKDGSTKWGLRKHDVEEFCEVVEKYGPWDHALKSLMASIAQYQAKAR